MSRAARAGVFLAGAVLMAGALAAAVSGLPDFESPLGAYATEITRTAVPDRVATNTVIDVTFDYRGLDTLGEEFMIFVAAVGTSVLLRGMRRPAERDAEAITAPSPVLQRIRPMLLALTIVTGTYLVAHGPLSPAGGFQGGVVLATSLMVVYVVATGRGSSRARAITAAELTEATGAGAFVIVALAGLAFGTVLFENVVGLGASGSLLGGGTIPLANAAAGAAVAGAFALLLSELVEGSRPGR